jgi:hypothetical protein
MANQCHLVDYRESIPRNSLPNSWMEFGLVLNIFFPQRELRDKVEKEKKLQPNLQEFHPLRRVLSSMQGKKDWDQDDTKMDSNSIFNWSINPFYLSGINFIDMIFFTYHSRIRRWVGCCQWHLTFVTKLWQNCETAGSWVVGHSTFHTRRRLCSVFREVGTRWVVFICKYGYRCRVYCTRTYVRESINTINKINYN